MTKRVFPVLLFLLAGFVSGFASADAPDTGKLSVIRTRTLDIIYHESSFQTASLIAEYGDAYVNEISLLLGTSFKGRLPVYINSSVSVLNAYFSPVPYNRVVLYDTLPSDGQLAVFADSILSVFYHELVHAVSLNMRSPFMQVVSDIFSDAISVNTALTMPLSFLEGVTVSFESRSGQGRLNDPISLHIPVQAKLEGRFPSFLEISGGRDIYPAKNLSYIYGGFFSAWLQKEYGMESYRELWKRGSRFNPFTSWLPVRFHQVYGTTITKAWESWRDSIDVPDSVTAMPVMLEGNDSGAYGCLSYAEGILVWADWSTGKVMQMAADGTKSALFDSDASLTRLSLSFDGSFLAVSHTYTGGSYTGNRVRIFDMAKKSFTGEVYDDFRDASFFGNSSTLCAVRVSGQNQSLVVFSRASLPSYREIYSTGPGKAFPIIYNPVYAGKNTVACIGAVGSERQILLIDTDTAGVSMLLLPEGTGFIRYLQSTRIDGTVLLSFSWAQNGSMYRYGLYNPVSGEMRLQGNNLSGGVFFPVPEEGGVSLWYVARLTGRDGLVRIEMGNTDVSFSVYPAALTGAGSGAGISSVRSIPFPDLLRPSYAYNPLPWLFDGVFLPVPVFLPEGVAVKRAIPGFMYATGDPAEKLLLVFNSGISAEPFFIEYGIQLQSAFPSFALDLLVYDKLKPSVGIYTTYRDLSFTAGISGVFESNTNWKKIIYEGQIIQHWFAPDVVSSEHLYESSFNAYSAGLAGTVTATAIKRKSVPDFPLFARNIRGGEGSVNGWAGIAQPDSHASMMAQTKGRVYISTLPVALGAAALAASGLKITPAAMYADSACVREFDAGIVRYVPLFTEYRNTRYAFTGTGLALGWLSELYIVNFEIQRDVPLLPVYANRIQLIGGYRGAVFAAESTDRFYVDSVYARSSVQGTLVVGALSQVLLSFNAEYALPLREGNGRVELAFTAGIQY